MTTYNHKINCRGQKFTMYFYVFQEAKLLNKESNQNNNKTIICIVCKTWYIYLRNKVHSPHPEILMKWDHNQNRGHKMIWLQKPVSYDTRIQLQQPGCSCGDRQCWRMHMETASLSLLSGHWTAQILLAWVAVYIDSLTVTYITVLRSYF